MVWLSSTDKEPLKTRNYPRHWKNQPGPRIDAASLHLPHFQRVELQPLSKKILQKTKKEPDKTPTDSRSPAHEAKGFCAVRSVDTFCRTLDDTCQIQSRWQTLAIRSRPSAVCSPAWSAKHSLMNLLEHISNAGLFAAGSCFFRNKPVKS